MAVFLVGEANEPVNPKLQIFLADGTLLPVEAHTLGFRVVDISTQQKKCYYASQDLDKIQVYPNKGPSYIDVTHMYDDATTPGHKIGPGNYYAPWTASGLFRPGEYAIIWEWKEDATQPFKRIAQSFSVKES